MPIVFNVWITNIQYLADFVILHIWCIFFSICVVGGKLLVVFLKLLRSNSVIDKINSSVTKSHRKRLYHYYMWNWLALTQKLRTTEWLWLAGAHGSIRPNPCCAGTTRAGCPGPRPSSFWRSVSEKESQNLGSLYQSPITCHSTEVLLMFRGNLLRSSLCLSLSGLALGAIDLSLAHSSLHSSFRYLYVLIRSPWASSSWGWTVPAPSASPQRKGTGPFIILVTLCWTFSLVYPNISYTGGCKTGHRTSGTRNDFSAVCIGELRSDVSEKLMHTIYTENVSSLLRILGKNFREESLLFRSLLFPVKLSTRILKRFWKCSLYLTNVSCFSRFSYFPYL